jgi:hypothetical protein
MAQPKLYLMIKSTIPPISSHTAYTPNRINIGAANGGRP